MCLIINYQIYLVHYVKLMILFIVFVVIIMEINAINITLLKIFLNANKPFAQILICLIKRF